MRSCRRALLVLALVLVVGGLLAGAAQAAKPPSANAQMSFGVDMAKRGLWSEALFRFKQADRMEPNNPKTLNNLAVAYEAVGQFEQALEHYQKALRASPSNRDLKKNYSRFVEFYQGFKPEGEEADEEAGEEAPWDDPADEGDDGGDGSGAA